MRVAIYGAGAYGKAFLNALTKAEIEVYCFIDQFTNKNELEGIPILRMSDIENKSIKVYVSVSLEDASQIPKSLRNNGFNNIIDFVDSLHKIKYSLHELMKTNILWMRENNSQFMDSEKIAQFKMLLSDEKSKKLLYDIIAFRKTLDMKYYPFPEDSIQYFPDDVELFNTTKELKIVDCGAFIGDTVKSAVVYAKKKDKNLDCMVSYEPDLKNLKALQNEINAQKFLAPSTNFIVFPAGVWKTNEVLKFSSEGSSASAICDQETQNNNVIEVPAVNLDTTLCGFSPNYIKMDIEGVEAEALLGAAEIIKKNAPVLAICLYHKPTDLWEIPLLINNINPNYNMFLRIYGHLGLEVVLYCVPKDIKDER